MSTSKKDGGIPEFSADYRGAVSAPASPAVGQEKKDSSSGRESSEKLPQAQPASAGRKPSESRKPPAPGQSGAAPGSRQVRPPAGADGKPSRRDGPPTSSAPHGGPWEQAQPAGGDTPSEIDDFLPPADRADGEQMLTKWDEAAAAQPSAPARPKKRGRYRYGIFVGALMMIFALIGVGFIATSIGTAIHARLTDDSRLRAYDKFLTVVVAQDPKPFSSPDKADPDFVLNASLWQTMTAEGANYTGYDDAGRTIVPLGDVVDACHDLFGPDCDLQPKNPTQETFFEYDAAQAQFHVALYSLDSTYVSYTQNERKDGDETVLRVGYIPPSDPTRAQSSAVSSASPTPAKVMEYVLKTDPSNQKEYIYAVRSAG